MAGWIISGLGPLVCLQRGQTYESQFHPTQPKVNSSKMQSNQEGSPVKRHVTCQYCLKIFETVCYLKDHVNRRHHQKCPHCQDIFTDDFYLASHVNEEQMNEEQIILKLKDTKESKNTSAKSTIRYFCNLCGKLFCSKKIVKSNIYVFLQLLTQVI